MSAFAEYYGPLAGPLIVPAFYLVLSTLDRVNGRKEGLAAKTHYLTPSKQQAPAKKATPTPVPKQHFLKVKR
jgi:hypothetical protein